MEYRIEKDTMGEMQVPADRYWAAQTQRSFQNSECMRNFARHNFVTDQEVLITSLRLRRPVSVSGNLHFPHCIFFNTIFHFYFLH